jgi:hypothetical protein
LYGFVMVVVSVLMLGQVASAQVPLVTFTKIRDAVPGKFFDANTSDPGVRNPNALVFGLGSGFNNESFTFNSFAVSQLPFGNRVASDTLRFTVSAPDGFYVSKIVYRQKGIGSTLRGAVERGTAQWVVAGFPGLLGEFGADPNLTGTANLDTLLRQSVPVSITVSLFAGPGGSLEITDARVIVTVAPLPPQ